MHNSYGNLQNFKSLYYFFCNSYFDMSKLILKHASPFKRKQCLKKKKKWKFKRILVYLKYQLLFSKHFSKIFSSLDCLLLIGHAKIPSSYKEGYLHRIFLEKKLTAILSKSKNFTIFKETPLYVHTRACRKILGSTKELFAFKFWGLVRFWEVA